MIEMWDGMFSQKRASVKKSLEKGDGEKAFEIMHKILDKTWKEVYRVLKKGGFACINIGDATRTLNSNFALYSNHSRILRTMLDLGFSTLPCILWRKQTNAPNKFMGSGMLPAGAYVTLEHEYILVFRKGRKRDFLKEKDKQIRRESAVFWEERNIWYSDIWFDVKGTTQALKDKNSRTRSAAYPFELAYRLISMYSVKNDVVLDPFLGTGTTTAAAMASGRNSIGYELDKNLNSIIDQTEDVIIPTSILVNRERIMKHLDFVIDRLKTKNGFKHENKYYRFPVMTSQEKEIILQDPENIEKLEEGLFEISYSKEPQKEFCKDWAAMLKATDLELVGKNLRYNGSQKKMKQKSLF
jgi:DNA modification methylase